MIEVNLLPGGKKRASRGGPSFSFKIPTVESLPTDPWILGSAAVVLIAVLAAAFLYFTTNGRRAELTVAVEEAAADSARYFDLIQQNEALNARRDSIAQRVAIIQDIDGSRYLWPHIMDEISRALPDYTWLMELLQISGGDEVQFRVMGRAGNPFALARFMENLEASLFIRDVDLISSQQEVVSTGTGTDRVVNGFELEAFYHQPPVEMLETVPLFDTEESVPEPASAEGEEPAAGEADPPPPDTAQASGQDAPRGGP